MFECVLSEGSQLEDDELEMGLFLKMKSGNVEGLFLRGFAA